jgi:hypothetical protein
MKARSSAPSSYLRDLGQLPQIDLTVTRKRTGTESLRWRAYVFLSGVNWLNRSLKRPKTGACLRPRLGISSKV